jgi:alpha-ketoglutarate-dependent taurine dioxygenase
VECRTISNPLLTPASKAVAEGCAPRAWRASTIDAPSSWYYRLPERCLAALDEAVRSLRREPRPTETISPTDYGLHPEDVGGALTALEAGRGFVILEGVERDRYAVEELQALYWLVGQLLGRPFAQNVQGTLLYDVRDTGADVRYGARFSVTNAESTFHTDNSFGGEVLDYVGLLCVNTAKAGGLNQIVSAYAVYDELSAQHPEELETLYQPFHIDRRGGVRAGEQPTVQFPVLQWRGEELLCRYLRYWIETGHEKIGQPLTPAQVQALEALDGVLRDRALQVEFGLRPGDLFFINNRWILHNRTAFLDHDEPERRRHYVRLWLQARRKS